MDYLIAGYRIAKRRACQLAGLNRATYYYESRAKDQTALKMRLKDLASSRVRYGYRRLHVLLQREGWQINHKRVYRIYRQEGLSLRLKKSKKRVSVARVPLPPAAAPNERWSMDFMSDRLADGRRFRVLTLVDNFSRVSPALEAGFSLSGKHVAVVLDLLAVSGVKPAVIHVDNGPEFVSRSLDDWAHRNGVKLDFSRPGKPTDNPFIEAFNGRLRAEFLDQHWFASIEEARAGLEAFRMDHNQHRPHSALRMMTPEKYVEEWQTQQHDRQ